jgi:hypothetical protein
VSVAWSDRVTYRSVGLAAFVTNTNKQKAKGSVKWGCNGQCFGVH